MFCRVIDNHGDLGVCWRLSVQLAQAGKRVWLLVDQPQALAWMAPQGCEGVEVKPWPEAGFTQVFEQTPQVVIEAFGCELPDAVQHALASCQPTPVWINLEYFSEEPSARRNHGLPSPVSHGPAKGLTKWFYYPGLSAQSGGLLARHTSQSEARPVRANDKGWQISVFCYEPIGMARWLHQLTQLPIRPTLHVTAGRASACVQAILAADPALSSMLEVVYLTPMPQDAYDAWLCRMDLNLVRGEDSLVSAMAAGVAFLWQIYPQHDGAHHAKLQAFLHETHAPPPVVQAHLAWNADQACDLPELTTEVFIAWTQWAQQCRERMQTQDDLVRKLIEFVTMKS